MKPITEREALEGCRDHWDRIANAKRDGSTKHILCLKRELADPRTTDGQAYCFCCLHHSQHYGHVQCVGRCLLHWNGGEGCTNPSSEYEQAIYLNNEAGARIIADMARKELAKMDSKKGKKVD